jgi:hypothetical protein
MTSKVRPIHLFPFTAFLIIAASLALPACGGGGGGGSGGSSSGGGGGSSSGSSGAGSSTADPCTPCLKADACCRAFQTETGGDPTQCVFASACQSTSGSDQSQFVPQCQAFTTATAQGVPSPTECR